VIGWDGRPGGAGDEARLWLAVTKYLVEDDHERVIDGVMVKADPDYAAVAQALASGEEGQALAKYRQVGQLKKRSPLHELLYGWLLIPRRQYTAARATLIEASAGLPRSYELAVPLLSGPQCLLDGQFGQAVDHMLRYARGARRNLAQKTIRG